MKLPGIIAASLACALVGAAPLPTVYTAPAGARVAGAPHKHRPYDFILPNGRIVAPVGISAVVGANALGVTLAPGGKYAIVSNDDEGDAGASSSIDPAVSGGYTLTVVRTSDMAVTDVYRNPKQAFFLGVAALKDPSDPARTLVLAAGGGSGTLDFLQLDSLGKLRQIAPPLAMPPAADPRFANQGHAFPGSIALSPNGRVAYVVDNLANSVTAVDLRTRTLMHSAPVGYFPWDAAAAHNRLYVTDPGLMIYRRLSTPVAYPQFANVPFVPDSASALTTVPLGAGGDVLPQSTLSTRMDVAPDGIQNVGGAHPSAIAISKNGEYAYVCMTNVDRIAIVDLHGTPRVVGGLELRLFAYSPYGTQPDAIVRSPDGKRLYVALAGMNAVAVLDSTNPRKLHRLGLIPTGWYPSALAISPTGRYVYVANAKGLGQEPGSQGGRPDWSTLQRIDMHKLPLEKTTMSALRYLRVPRRPVANAIVPPLRSHRRSSAIRHVVFIMQGDDTFDAALGDLTGPSGTAYGRGDPLLATDGKNVTPNLHALARRFALADNFYSDARSADAAHQFAAGGIATTYTEKTLPVKAGRAPLVGDDPEDYPRAGYLFNAAARAGLSYRDYGAFLRLAGYQNGTYTLDVPALGALSGHVDLRYPGWNPAVSDVARAQEFIRDYGSLERQNATPNFAYVWLPPGNAADGDRALGTIVAFLTHEPAWRSTAIFVTPQNAQNGRDHISPQRTYALVISPYAKRHYIGTLHFSTASILKTEEELLGLPPLTLDDLLATDMSGLFRANADAAPFNAILPASGTASAQKAASRVPDN